MSKVFIFSTTRRHGGAHIAATNLFSALSDSGVNVKLISLPDDPVGNNLFRGFIALERFISFVLGDRNIGFKSTGLFGVYNGHSLHEKDIVHIHWISCGLISLKSILRIKSSVVITFHDKWWFSGRSHLSVGASNWLDKYILSLKERILSNSKALVFPSDMLLREFESFYPQFRYKTMVIPNVLSLGSPSFSKATSIPRKVIGINFANPLTNSAKGSAYLLELVKHIAANRLEVQFLHVGAYSTKDKVMADESGVSFQFLGYLSREELTDFYSKIDILYHPSLYENLSTVIIEAIMMNIPVYCFNVGGNSEISNVTFEENRPPNLVLKDLLYYDFQQKTNAFLEMFSNTKVLFKHLNLYDSLYNNDSQKPESRIF